MPKDTRVDRYFGQPLPFEPSRPGTWIARRVDLGDLKITAIALYGLLDEKSDASLHRSLSELSPVFDHEEYGKHLILGGDFNILPKRHRADHRLNRGQVLMERIRAYGLFDCLEKKLPPDRYEDPARRTEMENCQCGLREHCTHTRTFRDKGGPHIPYQDDYLFASKALVRRLEWCWAFPSMPDWPPDWPSDHAAIVAEFNV
jgi:exonuclease III